MWIILCREAPNFRWRANRFNVRSYTDKSVAIADFEYAVASNHSLEFKLFELKEVEQ